MKTDIEIAQSTQLKPIQEIARTAGDSYAVVERDAVIERLGQLLGHDGYVLLIAENIAKRKSDEFHVLLAHEFFHVVSGILHDDLRKLTVFFYIIPHAGAQVKFNYSRKAAWRARFPPALSR